MEQGTTLLLGLPGVVVARAERHENGTRVVHVATADEYAGVCPGCGVVSTSVKESVTTRPRDIPYGTDGLELLWRKRRWRCRNADSPRATFTEAVPQVPTRRRTTGRLRSAVAHAVACNRSVAEVAAAHGVGWTTAQACVDEYTDVVLHRARTDPGTRHRRDPPRQAPVAPRHAHPPLRRVTWELRNRRGRKVDPEWANRRRLLTGVERLRPAAMSKMWTELLALDRAGQILANWIAKEELRTLLACARQHAPSWVIRRRLHDFYAWCADTNIPEVHTLAGTIEAWWPETLLFLQTGLTNARTEGINRVVKDVGRRACGFRNPRNHRRRVRLICTRRHRRGQR